MSKTYKSGSRHSVSSHCHAQFTIHCFYCTLSSSKLISTASIVILTSTVSAQLFIFNIDIIIVMMALATQNQEGTQAVAPGPNIRRHPS
jgi:hypothetical protein